VLRVFHNVCSHRGMKLVGGADRSAGSHQLRYHCWAYSVNGDLKATPHIGGVNRHTHDGFDNAEHGLKAVRSAEFMGVIFINLSGDAPEFERHIGPLKQRASSLVGADGWLALHPGATHSRLAIDVRCNWKLAVENYCEALPSAVGAPGLNDYSRLEDHYGFSDAEDFAGQGSLAYRLSDVAGTRLPRLPQWPTERTHVAEYPSLYPNVLLGFQADHTFAVILTPMTPHSTREEVRIFYVARGRRRMRTERAGPPPTRRGMWSFARTSSRSRACSRAGRRRVTRAASSRRSWTNRPTISTAGWQPNWVAGVSAARGD